MADSATEPLTPMPEMVGVTKWVKAWEAAMAEAGYPNARLTPEYYGPEHGWSYGWTEDLESFCAGTVGGQPGWETAHLAFVMVDSLRPPGMNASPMLLHMLSHFEEHTPEG